jgi:hypothetical protein
MADVEKRIYPGQDLPLDVVDDSKTIELEDPTLEAFNGEDVPITPLEDGSILVGEGEMLPQQVEFGANLADELEDSELQVIFNQCVADVEADLSSRSEWENQYKDGLEFLGMRYEERSQPFEGASGITHPLLAESVTQFQAQAYAEILPSQGPVKTQIVGAITPDSEAQAARVKEYMNYQLMHVMEEYDPETDMLLFYLPLSGSAFRKVYYDQTLGRAVSRFIPSENLVVPYDTSSLQAAVRITNIVTMPLNDVVKLQNIGFYRDVPLKPMGIQYDQMDIQEEIDKLQGVEPSSRMDSECELYEIHLDLDLEGFEDVDEMDELTGIKLPYIVTLSKSNNAVLSIRRNWNEGDPLRKKIQYFVHYKFLPGLGFYGFGLTHMIGGLSRASTSILRQLIDAGTLANLPAGFKARGIRIRDADQPLQPGEFRDMDAPSGSLREAFVALPFKEPSQTLLALMGIMVDAGQRFASIADIQVGDSNQEMPVGTTIALLERGTKVMSAIHKRLHYAQKVEFNLLARIFAQFLPPEYPYMTNNGDQMIKQADFDDRVDILPVSDPNIFSMSQRIMMAQQMLQMAQANPEIHGQTGIYEAYRRMYQALNVQNIDALLPPPPQPQPVDPGKENADLLLGKEANAFPGQDHDAHITAHISLYDTNLMQQNPQAMAMTQAHIYNHVSLQAEERVQQKMAQDPQMQQMQQQMMQVPQEQQQQMQQQMMQQQQNQVATTIAELMEQVNQQFMPPPPQEDPLIELRRQELDIKAGDLQRKQQEFGERQEIDIMKMDQDEDLTLERIDSSEDIAKMRNETAQDRIEQQERFKAVDLRKETT